MDWALVEQRHSGPPGVIRHTIPEGQSLSLYHSHTGDSASLGVGIQDGEGGLELAHIARTGWNARLEAVEAVAVKPGAPLWSGGAAETYLLQSSANRKEIILLRAGDTISFPDHSDLGVTLAVEVTPGPSGELQVGSSVAAAVTSALGDQEDNSGKVKQTESRDTSETEDEDLDCINAVPATISNGTRSQNTPAPTVSRSQIVQETPTVTRTNPIRENGAEDEARAAPEAEDEVHNFITDRSPHLREDIEAIPTSSRNHLVSESHRVDSSEENPRAPRKPGIGGVVESTEGNDDTLIGNSEEQASRDSNAAQLTPLQAKSAPSSAETSELKSIEAKRASCASPMVLIKESKTGLKRKISATPDTVTPVRAKRSKAVPGHQKDDNPPSTVKTLSRKVPQPKRTSSPKDDGEKITPRSNATSTPNSEDSWEGESPKVAFSNSDLPSMANVMKFLRQHGGSAVDAVKKGKCDLLCVREGALRKSMKLLSSLALGIPIVTDKWLIDCTRQKRFLKAEAYIPNAPDQEREWGFSLRAIWGKPQSETLHGLTVYFTPALRRSYGDFGEVEALCRLLGASNVDTRAASKVKKGKDVVFMALEPVKGKAGKDLDRTELMEQGCIVYSRDLLTSSILRGKLELDRDEFRIKE